MEHEAITAAPAELVNAIAALIVAVKGAFGIVGGGGLLLGAWWIWNNKGLKKRKPEREEQPEIRRASSILEEVIRTNKHVLDVRNEAEDIAETVRQLAHTVDRQEGSLGKVHDLCLESRTILNSVNSRLDALERDIR